MKYLKRFFYFETEAVAAVEFALIAPIFFLFIMGILELGLMILVQSSLDYATRDASRLIRLGTVTSANEATFKSQLCSDLDAFLTCSSVLYNVTYSSAFSNLSTSLSLDTSGVPTGLVFSPGTSGSFVLVEVFYNWSLLTPIVSSAIGTNSNLLLHSAYVFQNEPY